MDIITVAILAIAGLATTLMLITAGASYWYWTRKPLSNVVLFSLAVLGLGIALEVAERGLESILGESILTAIAGLVGSIYIYYYLLNKTKTFRAQDKWVHIVITAGVLNLVVGALFLGWVLSIEFSTLAQSMIPIMGG